MVKSLKSSLPHYIPLKRSLRNSVGCFGPQRCRLNVRQKKVAEHRAHTFTVRQGHWKVRDELAPYERHTGWAQSGLLSLNQIVVYDFHCVPERVA